MKVSVVVPIYNVEKYIERCFTSVINQSYRNLECIFVDDCSPDNSNRILQELISAYDGPIELSIVKHDVNKGLSGARNTGTNSSTGEYIYYLDSDDDITPNCIKNLVDLVSKYKNVDLVQGNTKTIPPPPKDKDWRDIANLNFPEFSNDMTWIKERFFREPAIPINAWNKLIRRTFILENNLFFREGIIHEDEHWMYFTSKKIKSIAFCEEICYNHYITPGSIMQSGNNLKTLDSMIRIINEMKDNIDHDTEWSVTQRRHIYKLINRCIEMINSESDKIFVNQYQSLIKGLLINSVKEKSFNESLILISLLLPNFYKVRSLSRKLLKLI